MPRRSKLIDDYLRAHDPLQTEARVEFAETSPADPVAPPHTVRRARIAPRWAALGGGLVAAATLAVVLLVGGAFVGSDDAHRDPIARILSPEQAIAAVSHDLATGPILHWAQHSRSVGSHDSGGAVAFDMRSDLWLDLTTGASHGTSSAQKFSDGNPVDGAGVSPENWGDGKQTRWSLCPPSMCALTDGRQQVNKTINFAFVGKHGGFYSPLADVRAQLRRALAGKAEMRDAGTYRGVPVVKVVERLTLDGNDPKRRMTATGSTWIVRTAQPWVLKYRLVNRSASGRVIHREDMVTDTWAVFSRTPEALAHIIPPVFDPAKYKVIVQHLGPGSGKYKEADARTTK